MLDFHERVSFCSWNINGLHSKVLGDKSKIIDFKNVINKHDFIILTETWSDNFPQVEGFCSLSIRAYKNRTKKNSGRYSGGVSLLYKEKYQNYVELIKSSNNYMWCRISGRILGKHKDLFICGIYIPPDNSNYFKTEIFDKLEDEIDEFSKKGYVMLLGDFNARTGKSDDTTCKDGHNYIPNDCSDMSIESAHRNNFDSVLNSHGKRLLEICKMFDLKILNGRTNGDSLGRFTYSSRNGNSTVDYVITDQLLFNSARYFTVDSQIFLSDHSPIATWIQSTIPNLPDNNTPQFNLNALGSISPQFIWTQESVEPFQKAMQSSKVRSLINEFLSKDFNEINGTSIEEATTDVQSIFMTASLMSLKLRQIKNKKKTKQNICNKKWFDFDCKKARKELRQLSNQKHSCPSDPYIRELYHYNLKKFKKLLKMKKYNFHKDKLLELQTNSDNSSFWKILKTTNEEIKEEVIPPITEQAWLEHFTSLHKENTLTPEQSALALNRQEHEQNDSEGNPILNSPISIEEIRACVQLLKNNKAAASDKIKNEMIRHSIDSMHSVYEKFFNLILTSGIFPDSWCVGSLTPIFKSGNVCDPNNYRGICVSSCLGKLFSVILNRRLLSCIQTNSLLHNSQIGFLPGYRTSDHIFSLQTIIDKNVKGVSGGKIYACFIDFKKAFDSIWHDGLLLRLLKYNINGNFYHLIKNLYSKSKCFIKLGSKQTKTFHYSRGVRQGCILSPMLFNLYINELSLQLDQTSRSDPIYLTNSRKLTSLLYADDLVLLSKSKVGLQNCLNTVVAFCEKWQMSVNEKKTKVMIFSKKSFKRKNQPSFKLNDNTLEIVNEFTYLGVKMSSTGNFTNHLNLSREKSLHALFKLTKSVDFKMLKPFQANKLFDSLIRPILTYGCEVWGNYQKHDFTKWDKCPTEKVHLRFCKYYLGVSRKASNIACRAELGRFPLKLFIDQLILKFYNHLITLPDDAVAKQAFIISKSLFSNNKLSFHTNLQNIFRLYDLGDVSKLGNNLITNKMLEEFKAKKQDQYFNKWKADLSLSKKLEFFKGLKDNHEGENYLDQIQNFDQRRIITKFRISNHKLAIETGRYFKEKVQAHLRHCQCCNNHAIESEMHMLYHCPLYDNERKEFFQKINYTNPNNNCDLSKYTYELFNSDNPNTIYYLSKYIQKCFKLREETLSNN